MSRAEQKVQTRQRIVEAAARGFRKSGFEGLGVDGLARQAGVTSGSFYVHFDSKAVAFREAVSLGMRELKEGVLHYQATHGKAWWPEFVMFYLGMKRTCDLAESCTLQSLSPELARADDASRQAFEAGLRDVAEAILSGPRSPGAPRNPDAASAALASLVGAVTLGRAVSSATLSQQIAESTGRVLLGSHWKSASAQT